MVDKIVNYAAMKQKATRICLFVAVFGGTTRISPAVVSHPSQNVCVFGSNPMIAVSPEGRAPASIVPIDVAVFAVSELQVK